MIDTLQFLVKNFKQYRWHIAVLALLGFISSVLGGLGIGAVIPLFSTLIGNPQTSDDPITSVILKIMSHLPFQESIYTLLIFIAGLFLLRSAALFLFGFLRARLLYDYKVRSVKDLFAAILRVRWPFFFTRKAGHMQNIFIRDVEKGADLLDSISFLPFGIITILVFLAFAFTISTEMTFITMGAGAAVFLGLRPLLKKLKQINSSLAIENKNVSHFIIEHLLAMKAIKTGAPVENVLKQSEPLFVRWKTADMKSRILSFINNHFFEPVSVLFVAAAVGIAYSAPGFRLETFAVSVILIQRVFVYMQSVQITLHSLVEALPYATQAAAFCDALAEEGKESISGARFKLDGALAFSDVHFSYDSRIPVLSGASFNLRKGETVGLMGSSGAGKTTIADLILRLLEPQKGRITVDGRNVREVDLGDWRAKIGYVSQDAFLLNDTLANNIVFYNENVTRDSLEEAARRAYLYETIMQLKDGFHTVIGDRGMLLSGGQRQRVALARALAREPEVLILDEATSALDNESEVAIRRALKELQGQITMLIIAHRLTTVMDVDRLLVLDDGRIVEEGRPQDLLRNPHSHFRRIYYAQEA